MVAFHFPPIQGSSGMYRSLAFAKYLTDFGWKTTVLTAKPMLYPETNSENEKLIPSGIKILRSAGLDAQRHLSVRGRYLKFLALPDRWLLWAICATVTGIFYVIRKRPTVIFSTYPIASAHLAGLLISVFTRLPLVADFRDPMAEPGYPPGRLQRSVFQWLERKIVNRAKKIIVTTPGAAAFYREKYAIEEADRVVVIQNGFDDEVFVRSDNAGKSSTKFIILHSGIIYPNQRNPRPFFEAIADLKKSGILSSDTLSIRLRGSGFDEEYNRWLVELDIEDFVSILPSVGYGEAAKEMAEADGLLLLQSKHCNRQIPAKVYEYLCSGQPILALVDPAGDTGQLLINAGFDSIAALENQQEIKSLLVTFVNRLRDGNSPVLSVEEASHYSRRQRAAELASLLDGIKCN